MRRDFKIALILAVAALPAGFAVSEALEYFPFLKEHSGVAFWGSFVVTVALFIIAAIVAIRGERKAEVEGAKKLMIPLVGTSSPLQTVPEIQISFEEREPYEVSEISAQGRELSMIRIGLKAIRKPFVNCKIYIEKITPIPPLPGIGFPMLLQQSNFTLRPDESDSVRLSFSGHGHQASKTTPHFV